MCFAFSIIIAFGPYWSIGCLQGIPILGQSLKVSPSITHPLCFNLQIKSVTKTTMPAEGNAAVSFLWRKEATTIILKESTAWYSSFLTLLKFYLTPNLSEGDIFVLFNDTMAFSLSLSLTLSLSVSHPTPFVVSFTFYTEHSLCDATILFLKSTALNLWCDACIYNLILASHLCDYYHLICKNADCVDCYITIKL